MNYLKQKFFQNCCIDRKQFFAGTVFLTLVCVIAVIFTFSLNQGVKSGFISEGFLTVLGGGSFLFILFAFPLLFVFGLTILLVPIFYGLIFSIGGIAKVFGYKEMTISTEIINITAGIIMLVSVFFACRLIIGRARDIWGMDCSKRVLFATIAAGLIPILGTIIFYFLLFKKSKVMLYHNDLKPLTDLK